MKTMIQTTEEINIVAVRVNLPVRYEEEDIPHDAPMRQGDNWNALIDIDTGRVVDWPEGQTLDMYMKVTDEGNYYLIDDNEHVISELEQEYVPHGLIPGEYGDYVNLKINKDGIITNWPKQPDLSEFPGFGD